MWEVLARRSRRPRLSISIDFSRLALYVAFFLSRATLTFQTPDLTWYPSGNLTTPDNRNQSNLIPMASWAAPAQLASRNRIHFRTSTSFTQR